MAETRDLARFIRERQAALLTAWEHEVSALPEAHGLDRPTIRDHVPKVLAGLADALESPGEEWPPDPVRSLAVDRHVLTRAEVDAGLPLVVGELIALRRVVEDLWTKEVTDGALALASLRRLDHAVDTCIVDSTRRFVQMRVRLLETLERLVVTSESRRLPEFLTELLRIALDAIPAAEVATILVRDGDLLRVRASIGLEQEVREEVTLPLCQGFSGLVAAERRPVLLHDASTNPLVMSPVLKRSGLHALYGVPLIAAGIPGGAVIGVTYMGSRRATDFNEDARTMFRIVASRAAVLVHEALLRDRLEAERARFQAIADSSPAIVFMKDLDGRYEFMSRRAIEQVGYSPEAFVGHTDEEVWPSEVARRIVAVDRQILATRSSVTVEEVVLTRDGRPRTYVTSKFPVLDPSGRFVAIGGIATDITERKRHEEGQALLARAGALLAASLELDGALTTLADLVVPSLADWCVLESIDESGAIRRLRVVHADPDQADLARTLHDLPLDRARPHLVHAVFQTRSPVFMPDIPAGYLDTIAQSAEHRRLLAELGPRSMIQVPFMARGRLLGALVLISTDRRFGRHDLTLAEDLARMASLTIDNARLYAAAQRAVHARDEVLAVVAHDLRNPLNVVVSGITGVLGTPGPAEPDAQRRRLELALDAARRAGRLTNDLLDVARMEAGRLAVRLAPRDPRALLDEAAAAQRALVAEAGLELRVDAAEGTPPVEADSDRILQVLDNLLTNAVRFTPHGGRVALRAVPEGRHVQFMVEDTGPGIPPDERARVFERFWQGRRASRHGAGLGLQIARGIVEAHGGRIWIESPPSGGTRVCFTLPAAGEAR